MKNRPYLLFSVFTILVLIISACTTPTAVPETPVVEEVVPTEVPTEKPQPTTEPVVVEPVEQEFLTWFQYDQNNEDPASDERVGNEYLRNKIPEFNTEFEGKWNWTSVHKPFDKISGELVAATIAGGEVPDLTEMEGNVLMTYYRNGVLQDLTEWAKQQSWYADMDPSALNACTVPDGSLLCIPIAERPHLTYVWADRYPDGYPTTPEQFLVEAERLSRGSLCNDFLRFDRIWWRWCEPCSMDNDYVIRWFLL